MARRILIHAGFHKTGTTTLQKTLEENAERLAPHLEFRVPGDPLLRLLTFAAQSFSQYRNKDTRQALRDEAAEFFRDVDMDDPRPLLISHENLCGHYPGYKRIRNYSAAGPAARLISEGFERVTGNTDGLAFYYSTRRNGWMASCHWQRLKNARSTLSLAEFAEKYRGADDFDAVFTDITTRLEGIPASRRDIEDTSHPLYPALELLSLEALIPTLELPTDTNVSPQGDARETLVQAHRDNLRGKAYWQLRRDLFGEETQAHMSSDPAQEN